MKNLLAVVLLCGVAAAAPADAPRSKRPGPEACRTCHTVDRPTREKPSLVRCPRLSVKGYHTVEEGPKTLVMDEISNLYGPVRFSHRAHAEMAEMGDGCYGCHHYNQAQTILQCKECHSATRVRSDLGKPDMKGARHRQCLDCHLQWSHSVDCASCHAKRDGGEAKPAGGKGFPKNLIPGGKVYKTSSLKGGFVTFRHDDHAGRFGLRCVNCHQRQACADCHDVEKLAARRKEPPPQPAMKAASMEALHATCFPCHQKDSCESCHKDKPAGAFDHGERAGWTLNRFHARLTCRRCHGEAGRFAKPAAGCEACHAGWQKSFDHRKTGLALDETHSALDCSGCHQDERFAAAPSCAGCHPAEKSYPKDKPGKPAAAAGRP